MARYYLVFFTTTKLFYYSEGKQHFVTADHSSDVGFVQLLICCLLVLVETKKSEHSKIRITPEGGIPSSI